jgi:hypothetical protein
MLSCKEVSRLNSERFDRPLTMLERISIWLHLRFCDACKKVLAQFRFMHQAMTQYREGSSSRSDLEKNFVKKDL